jgi:hypothetical protein
MILERRTGGTSWTLAATRPKFLRLCADEIVYVKRLNVERLSEERLGEAERELEVAEAFLADGLLRNAAGKAFQAWKSLLSHLALRNLALLEERYKGYKRLGNAAVPLYEWIAATAPTSRLMEIAALLEKAVPNVVELTALALQLHEYQYNGPDPEGVRSKIPDDETAARLIATFIARLKAVLLSHKGAKGGGL